MRKLLYATTFILVLISIIGTCIKAYQFESSLNMESIISGFFISLVTGVIVYFVTVDFPRSKLDERRINLIKEELGYKLERIKIRLNWLDGLKLDSDADEFKSKLSSMQYGDVTMSKTKQTVYDTLHEIKDLVEEFRTFAIPIILSLDDQDGKIDGFRDYLQRPRVMSDERIFIEYDLYFIQDKPVEIGNELHDLIIKLIVLEKAL